nr:tripartite tricarboxylate transporter substrate binding protein [Pseudomonas sp.]
DESFELMPGIPTFAELGYPELQGNSAWWGIAGPKGTPVDIVNRLNREIHEILADPKVVKMFTAIGATPAPTSVDEFNELVRRDLAKWQAVVQKGNIQP